MVSMVKTMNLRDSSEGCDGFWEAYRAYAEESRVGSDCLPFYVNPEHPALVSCHGKTLSKRDRLVKIIIFVPEIRTVRDHRL